jgi:rhodanese-related sulfurtransferase
MTASLEQLPRVVQPHEVDAFARDDGRVKIIDVRTPAEFESAHIPGSYNIPLDQLSAYREELGQGVGGPVVLVCRSGARASEAEKLLRAVDMPDVHIMEGGLESWEAAGLAVRRGRQHWSLERQVRGVSGALILIGTLGSLLLWRPLIALAVFIGGGLLFSGLTNFCGMAMLLAKLPYNRGASCDVQAVVAQLRGGASSDL